MGNENISIKDLTEMQRLIIGNSVNFLFNVLSSQLFHIENHDQNLLNYLNDNEKAQEDYILLQNFKKIANEVTLLVVETFNDMSDEEKESLSIPSSKLENFLHDLFNLVRCDHDN